MMDLKKVEGDKGDKVDKVDKQVVAHSTFSLLRWRSSESRWRMVGMRMGVKPHVLSHQTFCSRFWCCLYQTQAHGIKLGECLGFFYGDY